MDNSTTRPGNKQWVERYVKELTALGALMVIANMIYGGLGVTQWSELSEYRWMIGSSSVHMASLCLKGVLAISLASFLSYALGTRQEPGWILRSAEKMLYILAGLALLGCLFQTLHVWQIAGHSAAFLQLVFVGLSSVTSALIWVGLGLILRRVLPILEEPRTLV